MVVSHTRFDAFGASLGNAHRGGIRKIRLVGFGTRGGIGIMTISNHTIHILLLLFGFFQGLLLLFHVPDPGLIIFVKPFLSLFLIGCGWWQGCGHGRGTGRRIDRSRGRDNLWFPNQQIGRLESKLTRNGKFPSIRQPISLTGSLKRHGLTGRTGSRRGGDRGGIHGNSRSLHATFACQIQTTGFVKNPPSWHHLGPSQITLLSNLVQWHNATPSFFTIVMQLIQMFQNTDINLLQSDGRT
mmetsp:Transcript_28940/g.60515  ORF Transcript_28940/g.60515 Transcript_28940/m.60515 type:complete len:241 (+) Transcript_28940:745-1467(+)